MKKLITILTILMFHLPAFAQHDLGLEVNFGLSYFTTHLETNPTQHETDIFYPMPSGQCGLYYNYHFKNKFLIGTDILFVPIYGNEYFKLPFTDENGSLTGEYAEDKIYRNIYYLGVPVYFGYSFKKLYLNLGFQANFVLASGGKEKGHFTSFGQYYTWEKKFDKLNINDYDYGLRAGLLYKLSEKFSIETNYYYSLTNILHNSSSISNLTWKVQQLTIGLRYKLSSFGKQKSDSEKK